MTEQELISSFDFIGEDPPNDIIKKCLEMCLLYGIDAEEFVEHWSAFKMTYLKNVPISLDNINLMEQRVLSNRKCSSSHKSNHDRINTAEQTEKYNKSATKIQENNVQDNEPLEAETLTEIRLQESSNIEEYNESEETDVISYSSRSNSEKIVLSYGKEFNFFTNEQLLNINVYENVHWYKPDKFTAFYTTQARIAQSFDKHIDEIGHIILRKNKLELSENEGNVVVYGRIKSEDGNKVNNRSVILETTREFKGPKEITLNISNTQNCSIFSGQIVVAKGMIAPKNTFIVQELYTNASTDMIDTPSFNENVQIIIAAGPFTICNNFLYEPLQDLLKRVVQQKPNILILVGPFVDTSQSNLLTIENTFEDHFDTLVKNVMECLVGWPIQVILIPSPSDANHYPIFPTPPYNLQRQYQNLICCPNPSMLNINGLILGITSLDILFQLTKEEASRNAHNTNRMSRLASHLLNQRSFYPLYPNRDASAAIDYERLLNDCAMNVKPHILILPSTLRYFIKNVDNCLVVNPERLVKNHVGGTYATLSISPSSICQNVIDRVFCQIKNI